MKKLLLTILIIILVAALTPAAATALAGEKMSVEFLYSIEFAGGRSERLSEPIDIFFDQAKQELFVLDANLQKIFIYDRNGMFLYAMDQKGKEVLPKTMAVDGKGRIFKSYFYSHKIGVMDFKGELLDEFYLPGVEEASKTGRYLSALCSGPNGEIYALISGGGVIKVDPAGKEHEMISIAGEGAPSMIMGMGVGADGRFLFTDMRPYSVVAFDPRNKEFKRIGTPGVLFYQLTRPVGVTADNEGHIFVTSSTASKVNIYDRDGNFIYAFGGSGTTLGRFYRPTKIVSNGTDKIYILENPLKRIQVFKVAFSQEG